MRKGFTLIGLILSAATLSDSWTLDGSDPPATIPVCPAGSGPKHEIVVARSRPRSETGIPVRLARPFPPLPDLPPALGPEVEQIGSSQDHPTAVDPASWLGRRHLRSPS